MKISQLDEKNIHFITW